MWPLVIAVVPPRLDDRACFPKLTNTCSLRHSSRNLLLNDSMKAFCTGFPGSMQCQATLLVAQRSTVLLVSSAPLSLTMT